MLRGTPFVLSLLVAICIPGGAIGCANRTASTPPRAPLAAGDSLPAPDADVLEAALRLKLRNAGSGTTVFVSLGSIDNWKDPPGDLIDRLSDLPCVIRPVSEARMPQLESSGRLEGAVEPATGRGSTVYWAEIEEWLSATKARVEIGEWSGPLSGGGAFYTFELRGGEWTLVSVGGEWVS